MNPDVQRDLLQTMCHVFGVDWLRVKKLTITLELGKEPIVTVDEKASSAHAVERLVVKTIKTNPNVGGPK